MHDAEGRVFSRREVEALRHRRSQGYALECPRCGVGLEETRVPRPPGVSYVRRRSWHHCPECGRSVVLDR